jgi:hypothetical protein
MQLGWVVRWVLGPRSLALPRAPGHEPPHGWAVRPCRVSCQYFVLSLLLYTLYSPCASSAFDCWGSQKPPSRSALALAPVSRGAPPAPRGWCSRRGRRLRLPYSTSERLAHKAIWPQIARNQYE